MTKAYTTSSLLVTVMSRAEGRAEKPTREQAEQKKVSDETPCARIELKKWLDGIAAINWKVDSE